MAETLAERDAANRVLALDESEPSEDAGEDIEGEPEPEA